MVENRLESFSADSDGEESKDEIIAKPA